MAELNDAPAKKGFTFGHALVIGTGTNKYGKEDPLYKSTVNDAEWLAKVLRHESLCSYPEDQVLVLTGKDATRKGVDAALSKIIVAITEQKLEKTEKDYSTFVFFFSGHGSAKDKAKVTDGTTNPILNNDPSDGTTELILYDDGGRDGNRIDGQYLFKKIGGIDAKKLILVNSCYSGGFYPTLGENDQDGDKVLLGHPPLTEEQIEKMKIGNGICVFSAAQRDELARATFTTKFGASLNNSPFVIGLSRGFAGKGNHDNNEFVDCGNLVVECTKWLGKNNIKQNPRMDYKGSRFVVGCFTKEAALKHEFPMLDDELVVDLMPSPEIETPTIPEIPSRAVNTTYSVTNGNQFNAPITAGHMDFSQNKTVNHGRSAV